MNWDKKLVSAAALAFVWVTACSPNETKRQLPAVNDENCRTENLEKMDKETRQELAALCIRRGTSKASPKREW